MNSTFFKQLQYINDSVYEVELVEAEIEHREPIRCKELEIYTLFLALAENITYCIRQDKLGEWSAIRKEDCRNNLKADSLRNFFPRTCCSVHSQLDKGDSGLFKEEFRAAND